MAEPRKEYDVNFWKDRIKDGQRFQIKFARSNEWGLYKEYYRNNAFKPNTLSVNLMFSILRSMVPQIYFRNPRVSITARKPGLQAELNSRIVQKLDNWLLTELATKMQFKKMITDTFFTGIGVGFFGYDSLYGFDTSKLDETGRYTLTQFDKKGYRTEFNANVNPGMPWFLRARPDDVVFPWGATDVESLEWVAMRVFRPLRDVKKDPKYTNTSTLGGTIVPIRTHPEGAVVMDINEAQQKVSDEEWVEIWQIHDARRGEVLALTMDHSQFIRKDPDELQIEGLPVELITFNPDPDYIYGVPDARIIEPQLRELCDIRTQSMKHRRVNILKGLLKEGAMDDEEIAKLISSDVQAIAKVRSEEMDVSKVYTPISPGASGILQDLIAQGEVVRGDVRESVGFSRVSQGEFQGKTHVSAEETKQVFRSLNIRLDERRDAVADLLDRVVRKFNQVIFTHWTAERVEQIVGPDGAKWWLKFTGPQLQDEYDLHVVAEEGPPIDKKTKHDMGLEAAEVWAKLNMGAIKQGQPVPAEIQRLIFAQYEESGLDIDKLLAQSQAGAANMQAQQAMGGMGSSPQKAVSPNALAQIMRAGGGGR